MKNTNVWTTAEGVAIKVSEMTEAHRGRIVKQLHRFASERKEGYASPWYKTGKTIGEWVAIVSGVQQLARPLAAVVAQKRKLEKIMETSFSKEQLDDFERYVKVQRSGQFNMFDPRAIAKTGLQRKQYLFVIENYDAMSKKANKEEKK